MLRSRMIGLAFVMLLTLMVTPQSVLAQTDGFMLPEGVLRAWSFGFDSLNDVHACPRENTANPTPGPTSMPGLSPTLSPGEQPDLPQDTDILGATLVHPVYISGDSNPYTQVTVHLKQPAYTLGNDETLMRVYVVGSIGDQFDSETVIGRSAGYTYTAVVDSSEEEIPGARGRAWYTTEGEVAMLVPGHSTSISIYTVFTDQTQFLCDNLMVYWQSNVIDTNGAAQAWQGAASSGALIFAGEYTRAEDVGMTLNVDNPFVLQRTGASSEVLQQNPDLFIDAAIEAITTATSGVSARYGRFQGGVVNAITMSGDNQFEGSLRTDFDTDSWEANFHQAEFGPAGITVLETDFDYAAAIGGYAPKDRLWYWAAGSPLTVAETQAGLGSVDLSGEQDGVFFAADRAFFSGAAPTFWLGTEANSGVMFQLPQLSDAQQDSLTFQNNRALQERPVLWEQEYDDSQADFRVCDTLAASTIEHPTDITQLRITRLDDSTYVQVDTRAPASAIIEQGDRTSAYVNLTRENGESGFVGLLTQGGWWAAGRIGADNFAHPEPGYFAGLTADGQSYAFTVPYADVTHVSAIVRVRNSATDANECDWYPESGTQALGD